MDQFITAKTLVVGALDHFIRVTATITEPERKSLIQKAHASPASRASIGLKHCKFEKKVFQSRRQQLELLPFHEPVDKRLLKLY